MNYWALIAALVAAALGVAAAFALSRNADAAKPCGKPNKPPCPTTTTAPTTTGPAPEGVKFAANFDGGALGEFPFTQSNCRDGQTAGDAITFVPGLRAGSSALRVTLRQGYQTACEVTRTKGGYMLGQTEFYGQRIRLPLALHADGAIVTQLGFEGFQFSNIMIEASNYNRQQAYWHTAQNGFWDGDSYSHLAWRKSLGSWSVGSWADFVHEIKWATDNSGHVRIWRGTNGGPLTLVYEELNVPTHQYGTSTINGTCITPQGTLCGSGQPVETLDKIGAYRASIAGQPDTLVDHDVFVVADTREAAVAYLEAK